MDTFVKEVGLNADPQVVGEHIEKTRQWRDAGSAPVGIACPMFPGQVRLDVGAAYAISSLNLISVTFMSQCLLREKETKTPWIGLCLIFIGVGLVVART